MEAAQLQALWDHMQIQKLLATYCRAIDRSDTELLKTVYWPDAIEEHGVFNGKAWDFADFIGPMLKALRLTMHSISNTLIELQGDTAAVETYVTAYHLADNPDGTQTDLIVGGRYLDRFERRGGEWRIAKRLFVHDWNQNQKATVEWEAGWYAQLHVRGRNDKDDPSYALFRGS